MIVASRAILEGRKTQTRRIVRLQQSVGRMMSGDQKLWPYIYKNGKKAAVECPYGAPRDKLWVRESWGQLWKNGEYCLHEEDGTQCPCGGCYIEYRADSNDKYPGGWPEEDARGNDEAPKWRPSIYMPRWASRIILEVVNIKIERLNEIKDVDCFAEGIKRITTDGAGQQWFGLGDRVDLKTSCVSLQGSFKKLWESINGKLHPWSNNPWVWVIEFRRIK